MVEIPKEAIAIVKEKLKLTDSLVEYVLEAVYPIIFEKIINDSKVLQESAWQLGYNSGKAITEDAELPIEPWVHPGMSESEETEHYVEVCVYNEGVEAAAKEIENSIGRGFRSSLTLSELAAAVRDIKKIP